MANLLAGREPSADLMTRLLEGGLEGKIGQGRCFELTLDEARTFADTALSPTGGGTHQYWAITIPLDPQSDPAQPDATQPDVAYIVFEQLLPDSVQSSVGD